MNSYLSREEKQNFVRATALAAQLELTIDGYAKAKSTDPQFLKYMRSGRTMLSKALTMRADALDPDAKEEFAKQVSRLELVCVPSSEAKKAYAELMALKTTLPMELHDFEDWYESVIETTCKRCLREDYADCKTRRVLTKYGVYPIDPGADGKCQYSYVGTPEAEELQLEETTADTVPANSYNIAVATCRALEDEINKAKIQLVDILYLEDDRPENPSLDELIACVKESFHDCDTQDHEQMEEIRSLRMQTNSDATTIKQLTAQVKALQDQLQTISAEQEESKEEYPVSIGLASGGEFDYVLPARMAETMIKEIQQPRHSRSTCAQYIAGQLIAIDLQEVVALHVDNLPLGDWVKPKTVQDVPGQQEKYRIACKCGAEYFVELAAGKAKAWCRECKTPVFADRKVDVKTADGSAATLLTNRYWVEREQLEPKKENISVPIKNVGSAYVDPVNPFAD